MTDRPRRYRGERGRAFPDSLELGDLLDEETASELASIKNRRTEESD